jgi:hypothetical protein
MSDKDALHPDEGNLYRLAFQIAGQLPMEKQDAGRVLDILKDLVDLSHGVCAITVAVNTLSAVVA